MARPLRYLTAALTAAAIIPVTLAIPASPTAADSTAKSAATTVTKPAKRHLTGTWTAADDRVRTAVGDQTVRMVARISVGGSGLRIRLSNLYGRKAITFGRAYVGMLASGAELAEGSNRMLTFHGRPWVRVPAGRTAWSDPLRGPVSSGADLVVSLFVPGTHDVVTGHDRAFTTTFLSQPGNYARKESGDHFSYTSSQWYFLDRIAVSTPRSVRSVVAIGDSLTDGAGMAVDANKRWTDYLFHRLRRLSPGRRMGVLNAGITGNRVLRDYTGPSALSRFSRDALTQPGVRTVVVYEGINDISRGNLTSAKPLINAYKRMIKLAHARHLKVLGATLTPFYGFGTWTEEREAIRQEVNLWIRTSHAFDKVLDFDRVVRDPDFPEQLRPSYNYGDHLHLSDAGRRALGYAIPLTWLH